MSLWHIKLKMIKIKYKFFTSKLFSSFLFSSGQMCHYNPSCFWTKILLLFLLFSVIPSLPTSALLNFMWFPIFSLLPHNTHAHTLTISLFCSYLCQHVILISRAKYALCFPLCDFSYFLFKWSVKKILFIFLKLFIIHFVVLSCQFYI